jgi:hypothetical protein
MQGILIPFAMRLTASLPATREVSSAIPQFPRGPGGAYLNILRPKRQKGKPRSFENGSPANILRSAKFSPEGFASPSFEEFAFVV